jgi:hypothetical protein
MEFFGEASRIRASMISIGVDEGFLEAWVLMEIVLVGEWYDSTTRMRKRDMMTVFWDAVGH